MMTDAMQRAIRTARATSLGPKLIEFLQGEPVTRRLVEAAEAGGPPIAAISRDLQATFPELLRDQRAKQIVGLLISAILQDEGFEVARANVRISDSDVVKRGSEFRRKAAADDPTLLNRLGEALSEQEAAQLMRHLFRRYPRLRKKLL